MVEVDLNNGKFRKVDLSKPVFCVKCGKEIVREPNKLEWTVNVHTCGYAFCRKCKRALNDFAGKKVSDYEEKLVRQFAGGTDGRGETD